MARALCSVMFGDTVGSSMSLDLKPYVGFDTGSVVLRCDEGQLDNGEEYAGYITVAERHLAGLATKCIVPHE